MINLKVKGFVRHMSLIASLLVASSGAYASIIPSIDIDFRDAAWEGAFGSSTWTVGEVSATAMPYENTLWQDSVDGLGVFNGELDEVDSAELLSISFASDVSNITGIWITDLFATPDGGSNGEDGRVVLTTYDDSQIVIDFNGTFAHQSNGELFIDFTNYGGILNLRSAEFVALNGGEYGGDNEFSVAGFTTSVPEPATLALMGIGLIGLGFSRKSKSADK